MVIGNPGIIIVCNYALVEKSHDYRVTPTLKNKTHYPTLLRIHAYAVYSSVLILQKRNISLVTTVGHIISTCPQLRVFNIYVSIYS